MKPYDVEQAKRDVETQADNMRDMAMERINLAASEAIRKLEVQARAFAELPKDVWTLFVEAEHAIIEEVSTNPPQSIEWIRFGNYIEIGGRLGNFARSFPRDGGMVKLRGAKKYRLIAFFIPMDE